jgi:hypothetical protein
VTALSYSPLAHKVPGVRDPVRKPVTIRKVWGCLVHTTGGGVTAKARAKWRGLSHPLDVALAVYIDFQNGAAGYFWGGPGYVIDHDGSIHQIAPDEVRTEHAGSGNRMLYHTGSWVNRVAPEVVAQWKRRWAVKHPYAMFPSTSPNIDYVGVEMIPVGDGFGGLPMAPGLRFTKYQHNAAIALGRDLAERHGWPDGWQNTGRLLGHEDVDPIERSDNLGGWDPGAMRAAPYFDFDYVKRGIAA